MYLYIYILSTVFILGSYYCYKYYHKSATIDTLPSFRVRLCFGQGTHPSSSAYEDWKTVKMQDDRANPALFELDKDSFELVKLPAFFGNVDIDDHVATVQHFFPQCEHIVASQYPHAARVLAFDHIIRVSRKPTTNDILFLKAPLMTPHGDYTARSGVTRTEQLLANYFSREDLDIIMNDRFAIINLWWPIDIVKTTPLAMCTWRSIKPQDVQTDKLVFNHRIAETYKSLYCKNHEWVYFSNMNSTEAILLKTFDSDHRVARFCLHSAFALPKDK